MLSKGRDGWTAGDRVQLSALGATRFLEIRTYKRSGGAIVSTASVVKVEDGIVSFILFRDYRETVRIVKGMATEKAVASVHATAMDDIEAIKARATAFYAAKDAEKKEREAQAA